MFELSICVDNIDKIIIDKYTHYLHNYIRNYGGVFSILDLDGSKYFLIAAKSNIEIIKSLCEETICSLICEGFKADYIRKNLAYHSTDIMKYEALISAMVNFDRQTDNKIILVNLKGDYEEVNIYSLYKFKLSSLIDKWQQLVDITNVNSAYLGFNETYLDILRFLVDGIEIGEELSIVKDGDTYLIFDADDNILAQDNTASSINFVLANIIAHNPIRVTISGLDSDMTGFLQSVFDKRVRIK